MKTYFKLTLIYFFLNLVCGQNQIIKLTVQTANSFDGPKILGINMGAFSFNSNWVNFMERLGVNGIRLFVDFPNDLRNQINSTQWGKGLNGASVVDRASFNQAVQQLRTSNGRSKTYPWLNPINWSLLLNATSFYPAINGSIDDIVQNLNKLQIKKLFVSHFGCNSASQFILTTNDTTSPAYWAERWELYKFTYATGILVRNYGVSAIEFINEPDQLILTKYASCLNAYIYKDYYLVRSQSFQEAYNDVNAVDPSNYVNLQISAAAFSQSQFGGDLTKYLGDISVNNSNVYFSTNTTNSSWSNMQLYSFHIYSNTGPSLLNIFQGLSQTVKAASPANVNAPVIITEHNTHAGGEWNNISSIADDSFVASRLASQVINLISSPNLTADYVYKFSNVESSALIKTGIHWCEISPNGQFTVGDTALSAESYRLLTSMKNAKIYVVNTTDDSKFLRTYLGSTNGDGNFYLFAVNDNTIPVTLNINLTALSINDKTQILVETVSSTYYGEISSIVSTTNKQLNLPIEVNSTTRLTIQQGSQIFSSTNSALTCTANAGKLSNINNCSSTGTNQFIFSGTSNTTSHESTSVALIKFPLTVTYKKAQRILLNITVDSIIGSQSSRAVVLGVRNPSFSLTSTSASWSSLPTLLSPLSSGAITNISQNFINWSSNANFAIVGHISVSYPTNNQFKMIDVTDYVNQMINLGASQLNFLLYRPFRHIAYKTDVGVVQGDDLSSGSIIKINGASSANPPQLLYFNTN